MSCMQGFPNNNGIAPIYVQWPMDDLQAEQPYQPEADAVYRERLKPHAKNRYAVQRIEVMSGADLDAVGHLFGVPRR